MKRIIDHFNKNDKNTRIYLKTQIMIEQLCKKLQVHIQ